MSFDVDGATYYSKAEVAEAVGISRQTLYRWIDEGKVPAPGHRRHRDGRLFYSQAGLEVVRSFANHVVPVDTTQPNQLRLFSGHDSGDPR